MSRSVLAIAGGGALIPAVASAHIPSTGGDSGLGFVFVVGLSASVGSLGGLVIVVYRSTRWSDWLTDRHFTGGIGLGLSGLAVVILLPIVTSHPLLSGGSVLLGTLIGLTLPAHSHTHFTPLKATSATAALTVHQLIEGILLSLAYITGGALGVLTAVFLTLHTVAETAAVGGAYAATGRYRRGIVAVILMQTLYVLSAGVAFSSALWIAPIVEQTAAAAVACILLIVGIHECRCSFYGPSRETVLR